MKLFNYLDLKCPFCKSSLTEVKIYNIFDSSTYLKDLIRNRKLFECAKCNFEKTTANTFLIVFDENNSPSEIEFKFDLTNGGLLPTYKEICFSFESKKIVFNEYILGVCKSRSILPFFLPDFSDISKLINKINMYLLLL